MVHLEEAIASYQNRDRRFGGVKQKMRKGISHETTCDHSSCGASLVYSDYMDRRIAVELTAAILAVVGVYELFRMKGLTLLSFEGVLSAVGAVIAIVLPKERWFFFFQRM